MTANSFRPFENGGENETIFAVTKPTEYEYSCVLDLLRVSEEVISSALPREIHQKYNLDKQLIIKRLLEYRQGM
jgi:hypothetical protein